MFLYVLTLCAQIWPRSDPTCHPNLEYRAMLSRATHRSRNLAAAKHQLMLPSPHCCQISGSVRIPMGQMAWLHWAKHHWTRRVSLSIPAWFFWIMRNCFYISISNCFIDINYIYLRTAWHIVMRHKGISSIIKMQQLLRAHVLRVYYSIGAPRNFRNRKWKRILYPNEVATTKAKFNYCTSIWH